MAKKSTNGSTPSRSSARKPAAKATTPASAAPVAAKPAMAPTTSSAAPRVMQQAPRIEPTHDQISRRAYEVWIRKGCPTGQDIENWQQAERELRQGL